MLRADFGFLLVTIVFGLFCLSSVSGPFAPLARGFFLFEGALFLALLGGEYWEARRLSAR